MATTSKPSGTFNNQFKVHNQSVAKDLATKIKLEYAFKKDLRNLFQDITKRFEEVYSQTGQVLPANIFQDELRKVLAKNYKIISKNFDGKLRMQAKNMLWDMENKAIDSSHLVYHYFKEQKRIDEEINSEINGYIARHSGQQSDIITQTNHDEMKNSVNSVVNNAVKAGVLADRKDIAKAASSDFEKKSISRIATIATTETQNIAEYSKWIEARKVENLGKLGNINKGQVKKQWVTVLDERTRFQHVAADGQVQFNEVPFVVGGDKMMMPGDPSLGAEVGNFINCRCSAVFILPENEGVPEVAQNMLINAISQDLVADYIDETGKQFGVVRGYATTYDTPSYGGIIIRKEQMDAAIKDLVDKNVEYLPMFYGHNKVEGVDVPTGPTHPKDFDKSKIIGWFKVKDLVSTKTGLYAEGYINTVTAKPGWGTGTIEEIRSGKLKGFSIGVTFDDLERLPSGNLMYVNPKLTEISIGTEGNVLQTSLMPINQTVKPSQIKPKIAPQAPAVMPDNPELYSNIPQLHQSIAKLINVAERNNVNAVDLISYSHPELTIDQINDILKQLNYSK